MRLCTDFNDNWLFQGRDTVRLPHNAVDLPFSYFDEKAYQRRFTGYGDLATVMATAANA